MIEIDHITILPYFREMYTAPVNIFSPRPKGLWNGLCSGTEVINPITNQLDHEIEAINHLDQLQLIIESGIGIIADHILDLIHQLPDFLFHLILFVVGLHSHNTIPTKYVQYFFVIMKLVIITKKYCT